MDPSIAGMGREVALLAFRFSSRSDSTSGSTQLAQDREHLVRALKQMLTRVVGSSGTMIEMTHVSRIRLAVIRAFIELKIALKIPESGSVPMADIAASTGVRPSLLERMCRFAFCEGIFRETSPGSGRVSHTDLSRSLLHLSPFVELALSPVNILPDFQLAEALHSTKGENAVRTPAEVVWGAGFREVLEKKATTVQGTVTSLAKAASEGAGDQVVLVFPWEVLGGDLIVDLAGGQGQLGIDIAKEVTSIRVMVQDTEIHRRGVVKRISTELASRVVFRDHNIFDAQPSDISGPVVYLLRSVLHKWSDEDCRHILRRLLPSLRRNDSRMLVVEDLLSTSESESQVRALNLTCTSCTVRW